MWILIKFYNIIIKSANVYKWGGGNAYPQNVDKYTFSLFYPSLTGIFCAFRFVPYLMCSCVFRCPELLCPVVCFSSVDSPDMARPPNCKHGVLFFPALHFCSAVCGTFLCQIGAFGQTTGQSYYQSTWTRKQ